jgi:hypothetical protein
MAKRKKQSQADQSRRFIEAAKAAGADETGKEFERAFKKVVRPAKKQMSGKHR